MILPRKFANSMGSKPVRNGGFVSQGVRSKHIFRMWSAIFLLSFLSLFCSAEAQAEGRAVPFKVERTELHYDGERAELCFVMSRPLDIRDRTKLAAALSLSEQGKRQTVDEKNLSLSASHLCVQNLEHRDRYRIILKKAQSQDGATLEAPYSTSFVVPDRKKALSFVGSAGLSVLPRHIVNNGKELRDGAAHVLSSINVKNTHLKLYKIEEPKAFAGAWQQFKQINLSPSESLIFARNNGKVLYEGDLVFGNKPNVEQKLVVPLPEEKDVKPGLYYLAAMPQEAGESEPSLFAGQWFLVSDLHAALVRQNYAEKEQGLSFFVTSSGKAFRPQDVRLTLLARNGDVLGAAQADAQGLGFVTYDPKREKELYLVVAAMPDGQLDLIDPKTLSPLPGNVLSFAPSLQTDQARYKPGDVMKVAAWADDPFGQKMDLGDTVLRLMRPDREAYLSVDLKRDENGRYHASLDLPKMEKAAQWPLVWQKKEGQILKESIVGISPETQESKISLSLSNKGGQHGAKSTVTVKIVDEKGRPVSFRDGTLRVVTTQPRMDDWADYSFGVEAATAAKPVQSYDFMTGVDGIARVSLVPSREAKSAWDEAKAVQIRAEVNGLVSSKTETLILDHAQTWIGLRPLTNAKFFPENSNAQFDVIALDQAGRRRAEKNLYYIIYEEGRSFEWVPSEGAWDYKLLPQHRRVGGGALNVNAQGENLITWPVTTGIYMLEIVNDRGEVLARRGFGAGQETLSRPKKKKERIEWIAAKNEMEMELTTDSSVFVYMTDGVRHKSFHRELKAGSNDLPLPAQEGWGRRVLVRMQVLPHDTFEAEVFDRYLDYSPKEVDKAESFPIADDARFATPVSWHAPMRLAQGDTAKAEMIWRGGPAAASYKLEGFAGVKLSGTLSSTLPAGKQKRLPFGVDAVAAGSGYVRFALIKADKQVETFDWPMQVVGPRRIKWSLEPRKVEEKEAIAFEPKKVPAKSSASSFFIVAPVPLHPQLFDKVQQALLQEPQTTRELADWLVFSAFWRPVLLASELTTPSWLDHRRNLYWQDILKRQNVDGGFARYQSGEPSDFESTTAALLLLNDHVQLAADQAAAWLGGKLTNTWYEESERPVRTLAIEALARTNRGDVSSLRYMAETSEGKSLSLITLSALALAFDERKEEEASARWFDLALRRLEEAQAQEKQSLPQALVLLARHKLMSADKMMERLHLLEGAGGLSDAQLPSYLEALAQASLHDGSWLLAGSKGKEEKKKYFGIEAFTNTKDLFNQSGRALYVAHLSRTEGGDSRSSAPTIQREMYHLDGLRVSPSETLKVGTWYVLYLQGGEKDEEASDFRVVLPDLSAFDVRSIGRGKSAVAYTHFPWLESGLNDTDHFAVTGTSIGFDVVKREGSNVWRTAVLLRAKQAGRTTVPSVLVREGGQALSSPQLSPRVTIE